MLEGKVALITGASSGIGCATATVMARHGAKVLLAARREAELEGAVRQLRDEGAEAAYIRADVTAEEDVERMVAFALDQFGRLDCAVNNAGGGARAKYEWPQGDLESYLQTVEQNVASTWLCMKYEIAAMLEQGKGAIVNTSSIAGMRTNLREGYTSAKHAVNGLTYTGAVKYGSAGIRVNAVAPGIIEAGIWPALFAEDPTLRSRWEDDVPLARVGTVYEVGEASAWLCSDAASFVTGVVLPVDGGTTLTVKHPG